MMHKNSILNRGADLVTVRTDVTREQGRTLEGATEHGEQQHPLGGHGEKPPSREELDPDLPASYYTRRGLQQPPPFAYKYRAVNDSAPRIVRPPVEDKPAPSPSTPVGARPPMQRPRPSNVTKVSVWKLPVGASVGIARLNNTALTVSELVHLASISNPTYDVAVICAAITLGLAPGNRNEKLSMIEDAKKVWGTTQRSLIRASDLLSRIRCFDIDCAPAWRKRLVSLAVQEVQEGFPGFEEVVAKNGSAASGVGKLYLWAWLVSGRGGGPDDGEETYISSATFVSHTPAMGNNNDSDSDTGSGGGRKGDSSAPLTRHSVAEPVTPPDSPGRGDEKRKLHGTSVGRPSTSPGLTINTKMSPPTHPPPSHQPPAREDVNPMSPIADLDGLEEDLYGSEGGTSRSGTPSSHGSRRAFTPSPPPLDLSRVKAQLNVATTSLGSDRGVSPVSSSSDTDSNKERCARTPKAAKVPHTPKKTKKMKIGLVGLDKLLAKTPRLDADVEGNLSETLSSARAADEKDDDGGGGEDGAVVVNPHLLLQQWMMFPIASPVQRKLDASTAEKPVGTPPPPTLASSSSSMSIGSSGGSISSRDSAGSAWTDKRSVSISPPTLRDDNDRKPRGFSNVGKDKYREYDDDSPFDSEASYETDSDYEGEDSDSDEEGSSENLGSSSSSLSISSHNTDEEDNSVSGDVASKKAVKFAPPPGPPPGKKKVEKSGRKMAPPKGPPPKKEARTNSLLQVARKRMSDPKSVHGTGVRKFL